MNIMNRIKALFSLFFRKKEDVIYTHENIQSIEFTETTENLINALISSDTDRTEVVYQLKKYCVFTKTYMEECPERFIFAILKISVSSGTFKKVDFKKAMDLAMYDYRDVLIASGFGNDIYLHNDWAKESLEGNSSAET